ncbi:MAG: hypothetical protein ACC661_10815, partial [Verrucomicrobiales bacterium]
IDTQRTLFTTQDEAAVSKGQVSKNYVSLFKALAGGAALPTADEMVAPPTHGQMRKQAREKKRAARAASSGESADDAEAGETELGE